MILKRAESPSKNMISAEYFGMIVRVIERVGGNVAFIICSGVNVTRGLPSSSSGELGTVKFSVPGIWM